MHIQLYMHVFVGKLSSSITKFADHSSLGGTDTIKSIIRIKELSIPVWGQCVLHDNKSRLIKGHIKFENINQPLARLNIRVINEVNTPHLSLAR